MKSIAFRITALGKKRRLSLITENNRHVCVALIRIIDKGSWGKRKNKQYHPLTITCGADFIEQTHTSSIRACVHYMHKQWDWKNHGDKTMVRVLMDPYSGRVSQMHTS